MLINFRQGIIRYPAVAGTGQTFLQNSGNSVNLLTTNGPTIVAFAHKNQNYQFTESSDVTPAWTNLPSGNTWLYWDLNPVTAARTFGYTTLAPISQPTQPSNPATGQHWFDTANSTMKVYNGTRFVEKIRVFAARRTTGGFFPLGSNQGKPFAGSQVGLRNSQVFAGSILFDSTGLPIIRLTGPVAMSGSPLTIVDLDGTFFTTESEFFANGSHVNAIRLESDAIVAEAEENLPAFHVVQWNDFNTVGLGTYNDIGDTAFGIVVEEALLGEPVTVVAQGIITNEAWNWQTVGAELWVSVNGELVDSDPHDLNVSSYPIRRPPIARVIGPRQIIFMQGLGLEGPRGPAGTAGFASDDELGNVYLSVEPAVASLPIAVGVNDPDFLNALQNVVEDLTPQLGGDLDVNGKDIISANDLVLTAGGSPYTVVIQNLRWPNEDGSSGHVLTTDGAGNLSFAAASAATNLSDLGDTNISGSPDTGNVLVFRSGFWENDTPADAGLVPDTRTIAPQSNVGITINGVESGSTALANNITVGLNLVKHPVHSGVAVTAGAGLTGGGTIASSFTIDVATASASRIVVNADNIDLATTGVLAGQYTNPVITVDAYGRLTDVQVGSPFQFAIGAGLQLTGSPQTLRVHAGDGITLTGSPTGAVSVNSTVVRTTGNQVIAGFKTFTDTVTIFATEALQLHGDNRDPRIGFYGSPENARVGYLEEAYDVGDQVWNISLVNEDQDGGSINITAQTGGIILNLSDGLSINGDAGSAGQVLTSNGTGLAPTWENSATYLGGDGIEIGAGSPDVIDVDSTVVRTTGTQSIAGFKTFTDDAVFTDQLIVGDLGALAFYDDNNVVQNLIFASGSPRQYLKVRNAVADATLWEVRARAGSFGSPTPAADREATLALTRTNENGTEEFLDLYNNGYLSLSEKISTAYGIRIQKRGDGEYRPFYFDWYDGSTVVDGLDIISPDDENGPYFQFHQPIRANQVLIGVGSPSNFPFHMKNAGDAVYAKLEGASDGDNYASLELRSVGTTHTWQLAHITAGHAFSFTHNNGSSFLFPFTISTTGVLTLGEYGPGVLQTNGDGVVSAGATIEALSNVQAGSPSIGDVLYFNLGEWKRLPRGTNAQVLTINGSPQLPSWQNSTGGGGSATLKGLADVYAGSPVTGSLLFYLGGSPQRWDASVNLTYNDATSTLTLGGGSPNLSISVSPTEATLSTPLDLVLEAGSPAAAQLQVSGSVDEIILTTPQTLTFAAGSPSTFELTFDGATLVTTGGSPAVLQTIALSTNTQRIIVARVRGHSAGSPISSAFWSILRFGVKNVGGTASLVGGVASDVGSDPSASGWDADAQVSGANVRIVVTGETGATINWTTTTEIT